MKIRICFWGLVFFAMLSCAAHVSDGKAIYGWVYDANDCTDSAWHTVCIYYEGDEGNYFECPVNPETSAYICDGEAIPGHTYQSGDEIHLIRFVSHDRKSIDSPTYTNETLKS